jgi:drug/metabolite transporter (DMT)-like permease
MAVLGIVTSGLAYWVHLRIIRHVSPVAAMSPTFLIPVFGVTWGHLFLGEALSPGIFAGGALVLMATALVTGFNPLRPRCRSSRRPDAAPVAGLSLGPLPPDLPTTGTP